jgi:hypothetical protein
VEKGDKHVCVSRKDLKMGVSAREAYHLVRHFLDTNEEGTI